MNLLPLRVRVLVKTRTSREPGTKFVAKIYEYNDDDTNLSVSNVSFNDLIV
jgi:hypothetical protein